MDTGTMKIAGTTIATTTAEVLESARRGVHPRAHRAACFARQPES